jgi:hypothetical protein
LAVVPADGALSSTMSFVSVHQWLDGMRCVKVEPGLARADSSSAT